MEKIISQMISKFQWAFGASGFMLAVTTLISANTMFATWLNKALPTWMAFAVPIMAIGLGFLIMRIVDGNLAPSMKVAMAYIVGSKEVKEKLRERLKGSLFLVCSFAFVIFSISALFTFLSGYVISDAALSGQEPTNVHNEIAKEQAQAASQFTQANQTARSAVIQAEQYLAQAEADYKAAVKRAVSNQGADFTQSYYNSYGWLEKAKKHKAGIKAVNDVKKEYQGYIDEARANLRKAQASASEVGTKGALAAIGTMGDISKAGASVVANHNRRVQVFTKNLWIIDAVFAFTFLLTGFVLAKTDNLLPSVDITDVVFEAASARYKAFVESTSQKLAGAPAQGRDFNDEEFGEDFDDEEFGEDFDDEEFAQDFEEPSSQPAMEWSVNDISKIRAEIPTYLKRAHQSKTDRARRDNMAKVNEWAQDLERAGVKFIIEGDKITWL